ncbi:UNKNOWN [Stylonychia lemnae]|uniref:Uncharacterized protein n=1 Tax=Stylonychia lemnae TaxID=5949 RepID=A0A078A822_STYLE|nr:UNKNOWN [Stylonychia lemnae]|eukprot:CDW77732.1 UNKNOWN [Stylonychia lemnae]
MNKHQTKPSAASNLATGAGGIFEGGVISNTSDILDINLSKSYNAQYKITPASLRRNKQSRERVNYHLNKSTDYEQKNSLNQDFNIVYTDDQRVGINDSQRMNQNHKSRGRNELNYTQIQESPDSIGGEFLQIKNSLKPQQSLLPEERKTIEDNKSINNDGGDSSMPPLRQVVMTAYQNNRYEGGPQNQPQMNLHQKRSTMGKLDNLNSAYNNLNKTTNDGQSNHLGTESSNPSQYTSSHHFVMNKSIDKKSAKQQNQNLIKKYKPKESDTHPYDSQIDEKVPIVKSTSIRIEKQQQNQANINKIIQKQSRSSSRSFFSRRPKTVQQMLEFHSSNKYNSQLNKIFERKYSTNVDENESLERIEQEPPTGRERSQQNINKTYESNSNDYNPTVVLTNTLFKNSGGAGGGGNQFQSFKEALNQQLDSQNILQKSFQSAEQIKQQTAINQKLMRKQIEQIKARLDQREFEFESKYGLNQESEKQFNIDRKEMQRELISIYEEILNEYQSKILKKQGSQQQLVDRLFQGMKQSMQKINNLSELEIHQKHLDIQSLNKEIEILNKHNQALQEKLDMEQEYLNNMFEKGKQENLHKMVTEWESMKSLQEQLNETNFLSNTLMRKKTSRGFNEDIQNLVNSEEGQQFLNDYSGVIIQLKDLYSMMRGNVFYDKQGDFNLDIKTELVTDKIENEMQEKFKNVQSATAMKVLRRFYKKIVFVDQSTQVEEDPLEIEKQKLERLINHLRNDRDNDLRRISQLQMNIEQMQKSHNTVQVQYRETKSMLSLREDQLQQKEGEMKEMKASYKYLNDQMLKFQDQVKELMIKCDEYEQKVEMYKESLQFLESKHKKRKSKLAIIKEEKVNLNHKVTELQNQTDEMQKSIKTLQKANDPERKRITMVKKPIFDANGNQIGEGLVEQVVTMRTDDSMGYLKSMQYSNRNKSEAEEDSESDLGSDFSLDSQEKAEFENLLKEQGLDQEFMKVNREELDNKIKSWFRNSNTDMDQLKDQIALEFREKIRISRKLKRHDDNQKQRERNRSSIDDQSHRVNSSKQTKRTSQDNMDSKHLRVSDAKPLNKKAPQLNSKLSPKESRNSPSIKVERSESRNRKERPSPVQNPNKIEIADKKPQTPAKLKQSRNDNKLDPKKNLTQQSNQSKQINSKDISKTMTSDNKSRKSQNQGASLKSQKTNSKLKSSNTEKESSIDKSQNKEPVRELKETIEVFDEDSPQFKKQEALDNKQSQQQLNKQQTFNQLNQQSSRSRIISNDTQDLELNKQQSKDTLNHQNEEQSNRQQLNQQQNYESPREPRVKISHKSRDDLSQMSDNQAAISDAKRSQGQDKSRQSLFNQSLNQMQLQNQIASTNPTKDSFEKSADHSLRRGFTLNQRAQQNASSFNEDFFNLQRPQEKSHSFFQNRTNMAFVNLNSKQVQTDLTGEVIRKPNAQGLSGETIHTQTEEFMFPMDEDLKRKVMDLIGGRLAKYGDTYNKGSSFFTKAVQIMDELDDKFLIDVGIEGGMNDKDYCKLRIANGLQDPRYKSFKPVLKQIKNQNSKQ